MNFLKKFFKTREKEKTKMEEKAEWSNSFLGLSDDEKRLLLDFPIDVLEYRRLDIEGKGGGVVVIPGASDKAIKLLKRIKEKQDLENLIHIRKLSDQADMSQFPHDIEIYKKVLDLAPWDSISTMSIGSSYWNNEQKAKGVEWTRKAHQLDPNNIRIKRNLEGMLAML